MILLSRITSGTSQTPVLGKWLCSNWPFTAGNAEWLSSLKAHYGSFKTGELVNYPVCMLNITTNKLYLSSVYCGQVIRIDTTDGSVDGFWEPYPIYTTAFVMNLHGFDSSDRPVGGGYQTAEGNKHSWSWDDSNPASWSMVTQLLTSDAVTAVAQPCWNRAQASNYGGRNTTFPLAPYEAAMLGLDDRCAWWIAQRGTGLVGELMLVTFVPVVDGEYQNRTIAHASERRAIANINTSGMSFRFVKIDGYPWFVGFSTQTLDQEIENPGGNHAFHIGLVLTPIGPVDISWSGVVSADGIPKRMTIDIDKTATNYLHSDSYGKHRFRIQVDGGGWSDWRSGKQELDNLDAVVNGKSIWPSFSSGDTVEIDHQMCAGWPYQWDAVNGNPGAGGDPSTPPIGSADVAPPREVLPVLHYDTSAPDAGKILGIKPTGTAVDVKPYPMKAEVP